MANEDDVQMLLDYIQINRDLDCWSEINEPSPYRSFRTSSSATVLTSLATLEVSDFALSVVKVREEPATVGFTELDFGLGAGG